LQDTAERDTWTYVGDPWRTVLKNVHVYLFHQPADEFDTRFKDAAEAVKAVFMEGDYVLIYGWLQDVLRSRAIPDFGQAHRCYSQVIVGRPIGGCTGCHRPGGLGSEAETVGKALSDLNSAGLREAVNTSRPLRQNECGPFCG